MANDEVTQEQIIPFSVDYKTRIEDILSSRNGFWNSLKKGVQNLTFYGLLTTGLGTCSGGAGIYSATGTLVGNGESLIEKCGDAIYGVPVVLWPIVYDDKKESGLELTFYYMMNDFPDSKERDRHLDTINLIIEKGGEGYEGLAGASEELNAAQQHSKAVTDSLWKGWLPTAKKEAERTYANLLNVKKELDATMELFGELEQSEDVGALVEDVATLTDLVYELGSGPAYTVVTNSKDNLSGDEFLTTTGVAGAAFVTCLGAGAVGGLIGLGLWSGRKDEDLVESIGQLMNEVYGQGRIDQHAEDVKNIEEVLAQTNNPPTN